MHKYVRTKGSDAVLTWSDCVQLASANMKLLWSQKCQKLIANMSAGINLVPVNS